MKTNDFFTADICDAHVDSVQVAQPLFRSYGGAEKCCGPMATLKIYEDNTAIIEALKTEGNGRILVVDVSADYCAVVGENLMKLADRNGWEGIIVNGYVRDIHVTRTIPVGLWALGTCPRKSPKKAEAVIGGTVEFAGITFTPGAFVYADLDGIVVMEEDVR